MPQSVQIRLAGGFNRDDERTVEETLSQISRRLEALDVEGIEAEVSVKDREAPGQQTTLEVWVPGRERYVATSDLSELRSALNDVGKKLLTQLNRAAERSEPRNNRAHRASIRTDQKG